MYNFVKYSQKGLENEGGKTMKLLKQPIVWIGAGALVCAIVIAVVSTMLHPTSSVMDKFEKAINKQDANLLAECINPNGEGNMEISSLVQNMEAFLAMMGIEGEAEFEILVGNAETEEGSDVKNIPTIIVIKVNDRIVEFSTDDQRIITIDGKEYLYNE